MSKLKLYVYNDPTTYEYDASRITLEKGRRAGARMEADYIETQDVPVQLHGTPEFLGAANRLTLPGTYDTRFRALLTGEDQFGERIAINGIIPRREITNDPQTGRWTMRVQAAGSELFLKKLETIEIPTIAYRDSGGFVMFEDNTYQMEDLKWYSLQDMWEAIGSPIGNFEVSYAGNHLWFPYWVHYLDGAVEKVIEREGRLYICAPGTSDMRPGTEGRDQTPEKIWTCRQLFEVIKVLNGWRVHAEYDAFPSETVFVTILNDLLEDPSGLPVLDDAIAVGSYDLSTFDKFRNDFAVRYRNRVGEPPPRLDTVVPSTSAVYSAERYEVDDEGDARNEGVVEIPVRYPVHMMDTHRTEAIIFPAFEPDPTGHPGYTERLRLHIPVVWARGEIYVCAFAPVNLLPEGPYIDHGMLIERRVLADRAVGQREFVNEAWADSCFARYEVSRTEFIKAELDYYTRAVLEGGVPYEPRLGDFTRGFNFLTRNWMMVEQALTLRDAVREVVLITPENVPVSVDTPYNPDMFAPTLLQAQCTCESVNDGFNYTNIYSIFIEWEYYPEGVTVDRVQIEAVLPYLDPEVWVTLDQVLAPGTEFTYELPELGLYKFRFQGQNALGTQVSPWSYFHIWCEDCLQIEPSGGAIIGDPSAVPFCKDFRSGRTIFPSAATEHIVTPDPPFLEPIDGAYVIAWLQLYSDPGAAEPFIIDPNGYTATSFKIIAQGGAPGVDVDIGWNVIQYLSEEDCIPFQVLRCRICDPCDTAEMRPNARYTFNSACFTFNPALTRWPQMHAPMRAGDGKIWFISRPGAANFNGSGLFFQAQVYNPATKTFTLVNRTAALNQYVAAGDLSLYETACCAPGGTGDEFVFDVTESGGLGTNFGWYAGAPCIIGNYAYFFGGLGRTGGFNTGYGIISGAKSGLARGIARMDLTTQVANREVDVAAPFGVALCTSAVMGGRCYWIGGWVGSMDDEFVITNTISASAPPGCQNQPCFKHNVNGGDGLGGKTFSWAPGESSVTVHDDCPVAFATGYMTGGSFGFLQVNPANNASQGLSWGIGNYGDVLAPCVTVGVAGGAEKIWLLPGYRDPTGVQIGEENVNLGGENILAFDTGWETLPAFPYGLRLSQVQMYCEDDFLVVQGGRQWTGSAWIDSPYTFVWDGEEWHEQYMGWERRFGGVSAVTDPESEERYTVMAFGRLQPFALANARGQIVRREEVRASPPTSPGEFPGLTSLFATTHDGYIALRWSGENLYPGWKHINVYRTVTEGVLVDYAPPIGTPPLRRQALSWCETCYEDCLILHGANYFYQIGWFYDAKLAGAAGGGEHQGTDPVFSNVFQVPAISTKGPAVKPFETTSGYEPPDPPFVAYIFFSWDYEGRPENDFDDCILGPIIEFSESGFEGTWVEIANAFEDELTWGGVTNYYSESFQTGHNYFRVATVNVTGIRSYWSDIIDIFVPSS